jgi:hypothetical protein
MGQADFGSCTADDISCLCHNDAFVTSVTDCINVSCSGDDREAAFVGSQELCAAVVSGSLANSLVTLVVGC